MHTQKQQETFPRVCRACGGLTRQKGEHAYTGISIAGRSDMAGRSNDYDRMPFALAGLLAAFLAGGIAVASFRAVAPEAAVTLPDLSHAQLAEVRDASGRTVLTGEFRERIDALGNTERDAALIDRRGRRVIGEIEIDIPGPNAMSALQELDIDIIGIEPSAKYALFVDDREVATFTTDDRGGIDMKVHSGSGQPPAP